MVLAPVDAAGHCALVLGVSAVVQAFSCALLSDPMGCSARAFLAGHTAHYSSGLMVTVF